MRPRDLDDLTPQQLDMCLPADYRGVAKGSPLVAAVEGEG